MTAATGWKILRMPGFSLNHPWVAVAPNCEPVPHPTRWCTCKVHTTKHNAETYVAEQEQS